MLYDGPYPFIQTGDIASANKYVRGYQQTLNESGYAVSKEFPEGTLVMAIAANIGDLAILGFRACFPDSIVGFVPEPGISLEYLFYNLTAMRPEMLSAATLNTQMNLNIERIGSLFTVQPPEVDQQAIVALLNRETAEIDALIAKIREGIEKLKEYRTALISAAVTGKIDVRTESTEERTRVYLGPTHVSDVLPKHRQNCEQGVPRQGIARRSLASGLRAVS
jgi:type I restriction enzyme S subunit